MSHVRIEGLTKSFGATTVIKGLDLEVQDGEFLVLLGPSGCGKTTTLRCLAGLEAPTDGRISLGGEAVFDRPGRVNRSPDKRSIGMVFQSYALWPHMTVRNNIAYPLKARGLKAKLGEGWVEDTARLVDCEPLLDRYPAQLSGGQQQRVALARGLVAQPGLMLFDEPLSNLDARLRDLVRAQIHELHSRLGFTAVFVTHDQSEALTMSDRIAVFNAGRVEQIDRPHVIYDTPRTRFVAEFIGETNLIEAKVASVENHLARLSLGDGLSIRTHAANGLSAGQTASFSLRPERIRLGNAPEGSNALEMTIVDCIYHGDHMRVQLARDDFSLVARCERLAGNWTVGTPTVASFDPSDCTVLAQ